MNSLEIYKSILCSVSLILPQYVLAADITSSGKNEIFDNPFIVTGFNPNTNVVTGYVSALRTAPGKTDECKFVFFGQVKNKNVVTVFVKNTLDQSANQTSVLKDIKAELTADLKQEKLTFNKKTLPGDCEWILPFIGEPKVIEEDKQLSIQIDKSTKLDFLGVYVIRSKRTYFHKLPDEGSIEKTFLVNGDLAYVYEEKEDWYYVKFPGRKKETVGWIKKSDTIQFAK
ncbi:hypothetical protein AAKU64_001444 [Undibacterium sp. GrIS 1.8]|uniref:hypothetical protein n=1 Tax=unclassified Undibacterium TaxID=2630295 RepID=UPI0033984EBF